MPRFPFDFNYANTLGSHPEILDRPKNLSDLYPTALHSIPEESRLAFWSTANGFPFGPPLSPGCHFEIVKMHNISFCEVYVNINCPY